MDAKNTRTEAEKYRQERKERIKKETGKRTRGSGKAGKLIGRIIGVVLCAALVCGAIWFFADFFGWPQKLTTVATVQVGDKTDNIKQTEFNYYYTSAFLSTASNARLYAQYGLTADYDLARSPEEQTTTDDDGNEVTYAEYFKQEAIESLEQVHNYAKKARDAGLTLTSDQETSLQDNIDSLKDAAKNSNVSLGAIIIYNYGKGMNLSLYKKYMTDQFLAENYSDSLTAEYADGFSKEEVDAKFEESPEAYEAIDVRIYGFAIEEETEDEEGNAVLPEYTEEDQLKRANEMISRVTDEDSFKNLVLEYCTPEEREDFSADDGAGSLARGMTYDTISSNMGEDDAKWAFSADRQKGDTAVWTTSSYVYAVFMVKPAYINEQPYATVRHLLVQLPDEEETEDASVAEDIAIVEDPTDVVESVTADAAANEDIDVVDAAQEEPVVETEVATHYDDGIAYEGEKHNGAADETLYKRSATSKEDAKNLAEYYLSIYEEGEKTESYFATLANLYSDDTSSTTAGGGNGGLVENMTPGQYVKPFEDWAFDPERKPGDVEIVETTYGYHIMYFVSLDKYPGWERQVRDDLASEKMKADEDEIKKEYVDTLTEKGSMTRALKKSIDFVNGRSTQIAASSY